MPSVEGFLVGCVDDYSEMERLACWRREFLIGVWLVLWRKNPRKFSLGNSTPTGERKGRLALVSSIVHRACGLSMIGSDGGRDTRKLAANTPIRRPPKWRNVFRRVGRIHENMASFIYLSSSCVRLDETPVRLLYSSVVAHLLSRARSVSSAMFLSLSFSLDEAVFVCVSSLK